MENEVVGLLAEIRDLLKDLAYGEVQRRKERERKQRYRKQTKAPKSSAGQTAGQTAGQSTGQIAPEVENRATDMLAEQVLPTGQNAGQSAGQCTGQCTGQKEDEEGKENLPPTPPIREKGEEEEKATTTSAHARADVSDEFLRKWKIPTLFHAYWLKVTANETIDNPERSLRNYWIFHERDEVWHQFKRDHEQKAKRAAKTYSLSEWVLCAERCANFRDGKCTCGENVPPACRAYPIPPEECRNFTKTEGGEQ